MPFVQDFFMLFGAARWTNPEGTVFPVAASMASETYERRIIARKRPYLDGAPLDDTGADPDVFEIQILFANGHGNANVPDPAYPDYHRRFMTQGRIKGTGTLYYPGLGEIRCRMKRLTSAKTPGERDSETVQASFWHDLESERATAGSFTLPSAKTAPAVLVRQLADAAGALGVGGDLIDQITAAVNNLAAAVNAPFDSMAAVQHRAQTLIAACDRADRAFTRGAQVFGDDAISPLAMAEGAGPLGLLALLKDSAHKQIGAAQGAGSIVPKRFGVDMSIFGIAAKLGQPADDLIRLNLRLPSLHRIPAGTPVLVKAA